MNLLNLINPWLVNVTVASHGQIMDWLDLIDSSHILVFVRVIDFVIKLYLILLINI
jgi:hypothetical protein